MLPRTLRVLRGATKFYRPSAIRTYRERGKCLSPPPIRLTTTAIGSGGRRKTNDTNARRTALRVFLRARGGGGRPGVPFVSVTAIAVVII